MKELEQFLLDRAMEHDSPTLLFKQQADQRGGSSPSDLGECAPRCQAILDLDAMDANYLSPSGESGQRRAAAGLPVAARRARSEVPVIATVIAVTM
jgi:hypothetical protein